MKNHRTVLFAARRRPGGFELQSRTERSDGTVICSRSPFHGLPTSLSLARPGHRRGFQVWNVMLSQPPQGSRHRRDQHLQGIELRSYR